MKASTRHSSLTLPFTLLLWLATSSLAQARMLPDFTGLVQQNSPAVVNISTTQKIATAGHPQLPPGLEIPDLPENSPFNELFRHFFGEGENDTPREFDAQSLGSGSIISRDGYVLTNYHVIKDADEIVVRLSDRRELLAKLIGADERSDLALLKIDADNLPVVRLGKSADLKVGEWVLAIGSPFGFDHSVTAGIVSAIGRSLPSENYVPFIQTDVAINPGNSGGPLFNMDGEVVGVNSQIYSRTGGYMGLSFAIPVEVAMDVVEQLKATGKVERGWLGVLIQDVTRELAESFGMKRPQGALVAKVLPDSPAQQAGLQVGDIILEYDGHDLERSANLPPMVGSSRVGADIPVKILRNGNTRMLDVKLGALPDEEQTKLAAAKPKSTGQNRLGISVTALTSQQREELDVAKDGVVVENVQSGPAMNAGIQRGDVILSLDNVRIQDPAQFERVVKDLPTNKSVAALVQRRGSPLFVAIKVPEESS